MNYRGILNRTVLTILSIIVCHSALALDENKRFHNGLTAFHAKQYNDAITSFSAVLKDSPAHAEARYNIAIAYYKLGDLIAAKDHLQRLEKQDPNSPNVLYTLGVLEKKLGFNTSAVQYFTVVTKLTDDTHLKDSAFKQIKILNGSTLSTKSASTNWQSSLNVGMGYDDSILDISEETSSSEGDQYLEIMANGYWISKPNSADHWYVSALGFTTQYNNVDDYNIQLASLGFGRSQAVLHGNWKNQLDIERSTLGDNNYLSAWLFSSSYSQSIQNYGTLKLKLRVKSSESLDENYEHLAGQSQRFELTYKPLIWSAWGTSIRYVLDNEARDDRWSYLEDDEGNLSLNSFTNLSAQRHTLKFNWSKQIMENYSLAMQANYRLTEYDKDFFFESAWQNRSDRKSSLDLTLSRSLTADLGISINLQTSQNSSSIKQYSYDQNAIMLSMDYLF